MGVLLGDGEQFESGGVRVSDPLLPAFYGIGTDVEKPGEEGLTGIERQANSPDFRRLERPRRRRDFLGPEVNRFALLVSRSVCQGLA